MEASNIRPVEEVRPPRDPQNRHQATQDSSQSHGIERGSPTDEGVVAASESQGGLLRDPAAESQSKDREAAVAESLDRIARAAGMPANTVLSIEVDPKSRGTTFLLRDRESGEMVRSIPEEEFAELLQRAIREGIQGLGIDRQI